MTTLNKTRPSYATVKVEVDLIHDLPKRINMGIKKKNREISDKWIQIKYDYLPKCYKTCKLQGYNEEECFVLHSKLFEENKKKNNKTGASNVNKETKGDNKEGDKTKKKGEKF